MFMESDQFTSQNCASKGWTRQQFYSVSAIVWPDQKGQKQPKILSKQLPVVVLLHMYVMKNLLKIFPQIFHKIKLKKKKK